MKPYFLVIFALLAVGSTDAFKKWKQRCPWVKCDPGCEKVRDEAGCYKCDCPPPKIICDPPKCAPGCFIEEEFDGPCPECVCKKLEIEIPEKKIVCDPPKCPPGCFIEEIFDGPCPGCKCEKKIIPTFEEKVICDPPKCPPGCKIETLFDGPCPGCECEEIKKEEKIFCSPPKCPPGCFVETVFDGPCPGCECKKEEPKCPPVEPCFAAGCSVEMGEDGCEKCECKKLCSPPKCNRYCQIKEPEDGGCPYCECPKWKKQFKG